MTHSTRDHVQSDSNTTTTWRMPAEWAPHERCLMAWPTRESLWGPYFAEAKAEYAGTANAIGAFEPVTMIVNPGQADEARAACSAAVEILELAIDDSWMRDSGPLIVLDEQGRRAAVDFCFNSWGERFLPFDQDATISRRVLDVLGIPRIPSDMILEGGSITVDGEGTLITTEQCLLNPNRNPSMSRQQIEDELMARLGVTKIIWLPYGHADDAHTDGHVDGVCTYVRPGVVIAQTCEDPALPDYERMAANNEVLRNSTDATGRPLEILELPEFPITTLPDGTPTMVAYANFYVANGGVVVPIGDHELDAPAVATLQHAFPDREVVGVPGNVVAFGGGGVHCITQQVPRAAFGDGA
ncbi:agmatine deiminase family protein [Gordonia polyisoprenivorans]|uniref:agmatine deiminase family protein n=1 Tax=Gordonia polyisoprenivorans TaxID=84595 RepID=UPI001B8C6864|nr:agmatine deiminase family protein [Gordonia polyisoprenivorans]QUD84982.1 agmatine deiminase family protein [Gordonia polyisoprenivorans]